MFVQYENLNNGIISLFFMLKQPYMNKPMSLMIFYFFPGKKNAET